MYIVLKNFSLLCLLGLSVVASQSTDEVETTTQQIDLSSEIQKLFDEFFNWSLESHPQYATYIGIHDYDSLLNDLSLETYHARLKKCEEFLQRLLELEPEVSNEADEFNLTVLKHKLETFINNFDLQGFYLQMSYRTGYPKDMKRMLTYMHRDTYEDYEIMLQRMEKLPKQFDQIINLMKLGVENNVTFHNISIWRTNSSLGEYIVDNPEESPLYKFFKDGFPENFTPDQILTLQNKARTVISDLIVPAYKNLLEYIQNDYVTREDIAISTINRGEEFYKALIEFNTGTNYTAEEIQNIGFKEVERIEGEMMKVISELGYEGMSRKNFSKMLREDPNNFFNTSEDLMARINYIVHELVPSRLPLIFNKIPETKLKLKEEPDAVGYVAYYLRGSFGGERAATYYVNTYDPKIMSKNAYISLSLHEGNPGHHFQISYADEQKDMPNFRRYHMYDNIGIWPTAFPVYTQYTEGWGLYAEKLGFDLNLYDNPLERFGHYSEEIFRACRLVVDTGIHALGWTRQEAIDYMFDHSESAVERVENEVDRYITIPGQALAYKIGEMKINELRSKAERELGENFKIKDFHTVILDAYGPLELVERNVNKWIKETLTETSTSDYIIDIIQ